MPKKYVIRVCFERPFTRMISSLKYKCPPLPDFFCLVVEVQTFKCQSRFSSSTFDNCHAKPSFYLGFISVCVSLVKKALTQIICIKG